MYLTILIYTFSISPNIKAIFYCKSDSFSSPLRRNPQTSQFKKTMTRKNDCYWSHLYYPLQWVATTSTKEAKETYKGVCGGDADGGAAGGAAAVGAGGTAATVATAGAEEAAASSFFDSSTASGSSS